MTVRDLIKGSMRLAGIIAAGETPSATEEADALSAFNDMLDSWSNKGLLAYVLAQESFTLIANQASHTMGVGGDFNTVWPSRITALGVMDNITEIPIELITLEEWQQIRIKTTTSTFPTKAYVEPDYPLKKIFTWPIQNTTRTIKVYSRKRLITYTSLSTAVDVPPGYLRAFRYNLAIELSSEYGKVPSPLVVDAAQESMNDIIRQNTTPVVAESDVANFAQKSFNWITGGS